MLLIFCISISVGFTKRPSSLVKIGWITLNSLLESRNANIDYFWKVMKYWMQKTRASFVFKSLSLFLPFLTVSAFLRVLSLVAVISVEVVKTKTSFFIFFLKIK